ncbi:LysE family transporter, partial [Cellulosimicrobium cellulans]|uniref:LysE family transporter n=1 Tax=Cellulosimicrobium cellulans TaxID=1710 RepID=UPI000ADF8DDF
TGLAIRRETEARVLEEIYGGCWPDGLEPTAPVAVRRRARTGVRTPGPVRAYAQLLALTVVNPATVVYFAAVVVGARATAGEPGGTAGAAAFVTGAFLASASWQLLLASGGAVLGRRLSGPRGRLATGLVSAVVMLVLVVALLG